MADGVGSGTHGSRGVCSRSSVGTSDAVLAGATRSRRNAAGALTAIAGARRRGGRLVKLLLVSQQQIATSEASRAFRALKRLLLGVGALVAFQMLQSGEGALTSRAHMRAGLIGFGGRKIGRRLRVHGNSRSCCCMDQKGLIVSSVSAVAWHSSGKERRRCSGGGGGGGIEWRDTRVGTGGAGLEGCWWAVLCSAVSMQLCRCDSYHYLRWPGQHRWQQPPREQQHRQQ